MHVLQDFSETGSTVYHMHTLQAQQFSDLSYYLTLFQSVLYMAE